MPFSSGSFMVFIGLTKVEIDGKLFWERGDIKLYCFSAGSEPRMWLLTWRYSPPTATGSGHILPHISWPFVSTSTVMVTLSWMTSTSLLGQLTSCKVLTNRFHSCLKRLGFPPLPRRLWITGRPQISGNVHKGGIGEGVEISTFEQNSYFEHITHWIFFILVN